MITITLTPGAGTTYTNPTVTACDSTNVNGTWYYSSTTAIDTFATSGCDSIVHTPVVITTFTTSTLNETFCGSYTAPDGATYTTPGTYMATIPNGSGCDSVITINLSAGAGIVHTGPAQSGCDSVQVNGNWYFTTTTAIDTFTTASCDSIVHTNVTVTNSTSSTITAAFCGVYTAPSGATFTTPGTYTDIITNTAGCDSVITLVLTQGSPSVTTTAPIVALSLIHI